MKKTIVDGKIRLVGNGQLWKNEEWMVGLKRVRK